jgi:hypothetical protein
MLTGFGDTYNDVGACSQAQAFLRRVWLERGQGELS